jgi:uncharacterized protein YgbK (DUF1537 family)
LFPDAVLAGPGGAAELPSLVDHGKLIVFSATEDGDLDVLVAAVTRLDEVLWVGSPGLAAALARRCARARGSAAPVPAPARRPLVVVGSTNPASRRQLAELSTRGDVHGVTVGVDPVPAVDVLRRLTAPILTLQTPDERLTPETAHALARSQAAVVHALTDDDTVDALVITGGETASTVLEPLGATGIDLLDEPEPGVVRGSLVGRIRLPVLIKAGGFGDDALLLRLCHLVRHHHDLGDHV